MILRFKVSTDRYSEMISACNEWIIAEYFEKIKENFFWVLLFPFFLCFLVIYGVYLLFYGLLKVILFIQDGGLFGLIGLIGVKNRFLFWSLVISLLIIICPIQIVLYVCSTIFALPLFLCVWILWGILYLIQLPFKALKKFRLAKVVELALINQLDELLKDEEIGTEEIEEIREQEVAVLEEKAE